MSSLICCFGQIQDHSVDGIDKSTDYEFDGWIEFNPNFDGISIYCGDQNKEKQLYAIIKINQFKSLKKRQNGFKIKYSEENYQSGVENLVRNLIFGSNTNTLNLYYKVDKKWQKEQSRFLGPNKRKRCEVCDIMFKTEEEFLRHMSGQMHKKKELQNGIKNGTIPWFHSCNICGVEIEGEINWKAHLDGALHRKKKDRHDGVTQLTLPNLGEFYCEICDVHTSTYDLLQVHYNGRAHKKKVEKTLFCNANPNDTTYRPISPASSYASSKKANKIKRLEIEARLLELELKKLSVIEEESANKDTH